MKILLLAASGRRRKTVSTGPGPTTLQAGDSQWGFYGEVPTLISQSDLANAMTNNPIV